MAEGQGKGLREALVTTPENLSWPKKQTPGRAPEPTTAHNKAGGEKGRGGPVQPFPQ